MYDRAKQLGFTRVAVLILNTIVSKPKRPGEECLNFTCLEAPFINTAVMTKRE